MRRDVFITIKNKLNYTLLNSLKNDLIMEFLQSRGYTMLSNSNWNMEIIHNTLSLKNKETNEQFIFSVPAKSNHVLVDFLTYFREKLKEKGIIIKK